MPATSEPVAMQMFFADRVSVVPSSFATSTSEADLMRPVPMTPVILFFLNRKAMPSTFDFTVLSLWASIFDSSSFGSTAMPSSPKL